MFLKELEPSLNIEMFETLGGRGAGEFRRLEQRRHRPCRELRAQLHAGAQRRKHRHFRRRCEVNVEFDLSRQLWSYLVKKGAIADPQSFIHPVPHMSFVHGADNVAFLEKRFKAMSAHHCYQGMEYTEDKRKLERVGRRW